MFKLILDRANFLRVRRGVTSKDIERVYSCPAQNEVFDGAIIKLADKELKTYSVKVGENLKSIAKKFDVSEEELIKLNGKVVYPTKKIFLPEKQTQKL